MDFKGNQLSRAPEYSYTLGAEYDIYLGSYGTLTPRIQYYWQDDTWFRAFNRTPENSGPNCREVFGSTPERRAASCGSIVNDLQEAYHHTDIKATWRSPGEKYWAEAAVQNLEDDAERADRERRARQPGLRLVRPPAHLHLHGRLPLLDTHLDPGLSYLSGRDQR